MVFLALGAADYLLGGKLHIGKEFERGLSCAGKLFITMGGFLAISPVLAGWLAPVVSPFFRSIGADPSLLPGILLACDAGGAALAARCIRTWRRPGSADIPTAAIPAITAGTRRISKRVHSWRRSSEKNRS